MGWPMDIKYLSPGLCSGVELEGASDHVEWFNQSGK